MILYYFSILLLSFRVLFSSNKRHNNEDLEVKKHRKKLGGAEGLKPETQYIAWKKKLFSIKGVNALKEQQKDN